MQIDFHYYATYCAAFLAGYTPEESLTIATSAQMVDECSETFLKSVKAPGAAATTQLQMEMMDLKMDPLSVQNIVRIWSSFHFLPYDLYATFPIHRNRAYMDRFRLICKPNSDLLVETVELARDKDLQAVGVAMHILADTWAHSFFAGIPSFVINNTNFQFYEILENGEEVPIEFVHNPVSPDDLEHRKYTNSLSQPKELSVMNLGHGRAGHLPDYSFMRYRYVPAWADYNEIVKNNPLEYYKAFGQMIHAMRYLRGEIGSFEKGLYEEELLEPMRDEIQAILTKRQLSASEDWKAFGEKLTGREIPDFGTQACREEYLNAPKSERDGTFLGRFITAALAQKSMVSHRIFASGNLLAGFPVDYIKRKQWRVFSLLKGKASGTALPAEDDRKGDSHDEKNAD